MTNYLQIATLLSLAALFGACAGTAPESATYQFRNDVRPVYDNTVNNEELTVLQQKGAKVIDVRLIEDFKASPTLIPDAMYEDPENIDSWSANLSPDEPVVVYCVRGKWVSQKAATYLKDKGFEVYSLEGGIEAWQAAGNDTIPPAE